MPERRQTKEFEEYVEQMQQTGDMVNLLSQLMASHIEKLVTNRDEMAAFYDQTISLYEQMKGIREQQLHLMQGMQTEGEREPAQEQFNRMEEHIQHLEAEIGRADSRKEQIEAQFELLQKQTEGARQPHFMHWWREVILSRCTDAFEHYISQILLRIFILYPGRLKSADGKKMRGESESRVEVSEVLEAGSIEEFIRRYAEKKVLDLTYKGFVPLMEYLNSEVGLSFDTKSPAFKLVSEAVEARNLIVHNAGRVSRKYLQKTKRTDLREGDVYPLDSFFSENVNITKIVLEVAREIDAQIVTKFKLLDEEQTPGL